MVLKPKQCLNLKLGKNIGIRLKWKLLNELHLESIWKRKEEEKQRFLDNIGNVKPPALEEYWQRFLQEINAPCDKIIKSCIKKSCV